MKFTDVFINKPVLATVVSLFILLLGLRAATELNVRQYPELQNAVISVTTIYVGADADLIQGFITTPLEQEIASADGIDYMVSTSASGVSSIQAYIRLDYDPNEALTQIVAKVNKMRSQLPQESEDPTVELQTGDTTAAMYLSFSSEILDNNQITDYLVRVVQPKLTTIPGVQRAQILGDRTFAMRAWLQPARMSALGITPSDVFRAIQDNNVLSAVGGTKGSMVAIDLKAGTDLNNLQDFKRLVVRAQGNALVRLEDIAEVELGSESYATSVTFNGKMATFMGISVAPDANALDVIREARKVLEADIFPQLPEGMRGDIPYDSTGYISDSISEVIKTLIEAVIIVIFVIYAFLGSFRSVLIPAIAVPLSMIGALFLMMLMGFTINLLTLLAMVLAIGIVVDDAIIVLENIHRHIEEGMSPHDAAIKGTRELAWPVVAMTTTLIAVYLPIGFLGGLTGTLFVEFAFSLAGAVLLSGIVALTLSPMMCAKLLKSHKEGQGSKFEAWLNKKFEALQNSYENSLHNSLNDKATLGVFGLIVVASCYFLFVATPSELEPREDQGFVLTLASADPYVTLDYVEAFTRELNTISDGLEGGENLFLLNGIGGGGVSTASNTAIAGFVLKPWNEREMSTQQAANQIQAEVANIAGLQVAVFAPPSLPSAGGGPPVQMVIGTTEPTENLQVFAEELIAKAYASRKFFFADGDLKIDKPRYNILIDREKAAAMGVTMKQIGAELGAMMSGAYANRFSLDNRSYKVIPQVQRSSRLAPDQLKLYSIRTGNGDLVPLSTLVTLEETVQPQQLKRFQQLNAVTISAVPRPDVTLGEAIAFLENAAKEILPPGYSIDYAGQSRQYKQEGGGLIVTFFFALVIIYLVLAAQFESFRDPIVMLITVPMSVCGAMLSLNIVSIINGILMMMGIEGFPGASLNIYTQVGLVTLIGVISKHGILIVEFANQMQEEGMSKRKAIEHAAAVRLRPVLMTTAALVLAMIPLLVASGPGGGARFAIGLVVSTGMTIGTLFTLFVVPAFYLYLGRDHNPEEPKEEGVVQS
ncbi:MAG: efflux RND transporter permease subunit [Gammaproteobacteria bacterium]|nr:efflux RND transporter permease subunit [Gammaproteobacteria bacterium]|tara:strand:- start:47237 stop:50374 length:3138 start_codon:yes stop_codon:yes gene_type:complete